MDLQHATNGHKPQSAQEMLWPVEPTTHIDAEISRFLKSVISPTLRLEDHISDDPNQIAALGELKKIRARGENPGFDMVRRAMP